MKPRKINNISSVLLKKGFRKDNASHHDYYILTSNCNPRIQTYLSRSKKTEYGNALLGMMKKQLGFDNNTDFENSLDCPFTHEDYIAMLKKKGIVK